MDRVYVMQLVRSFQVGELKRRDFLKKTTAALGSVAAANMLLAACSSFPNPTAPPVLEQEPAQAEQPPAAAGADPGLTTDMVEYTNADGEKSGDRVTFHDRNEYCRN